MNRRTYIGAGAAVLAGLAGCVGSFTRGEASELVEQSFDSGDVSELRVVNAIGDVTVVGRDTDTVTTSVLKRSTDGARGLEDIDVSVRLDGDVLSVETAIEDGARWFTRSSPTTDVTVTVPLGADGPVVRSVASRLGNVDLLDTRGDTRASTELGDVTVNRADGYLSLRTELGDVLASDAAGIDEVHTELGDVKVDLLGLRGDVDVATELGSVVVGVADDLDLDLEARAVSAVSSDLTLAELRSDGGLLTGRLNAGGHRLRVASELGDVSLRAVTR